eukprot:6207201-Pleurochrysis_carterae.AAC.1
MHYSVLLDRQCRPCRQQAQFNTFGVSTPGAFEPLYHFRPPDFAIFCESQLMALIFMYGELPTAMCYVVVEIYNNSETEMTVPLPSCHFCLLELLRVRGLSKRLRVTTSTITLQMHVPGHSNWILLPSPRRGGAVYTLTILRLKVLKRSRPSTLLPRSRYLLQSLASIIAANGRDDYGRASNESSVWKGNLVKITTARTDALRAHDHTVGTEAKSPMDHGATMRLLNQLEKNTREPRKDA